MQGSLNVSVVDMRSLNPRLLNPSLLNSCFTAGELAPLSVVQLDKGLPLPLSSNCAEVGAGSGSESSTFRHTGTK